MKKLLQIILASMMISCASQIPTEKIEKELSYDSLPKEFKEYRKGKISDLGWIQIEDKILSFIEYDINSDGKPEVIELYWGKENAFAYGFDLDNSSSFDCNEILIDREMDGLNGNEKPIPAEVCAKGDSIFT
ncbi:MAG: hypothetical protein M1416_01900 [Candidatus Pacearchaeota archaeon]|nr:hypothetical protein [Candidatus Pacearchaeota archaeon]